MVNKWVFRLLFEFEKVKKVKKGLISMETRLKSKEKKIEELPTNLIRYFRKRLNKRRFMKRLWRRESKSVWFLRLV